MSVSAFSRAVGRINAAWALALAPVNGREVIENPECNRDEIILVPDGPILVHPLLMIDRQHRNLHDRLDATIGWHLADAGRRFDEATARLHDSGHRDRWIIENATRIRDLSTLLEVHRFLRPPTLLDFDRQMALFEQRRAQIDAWANPLRALHDTGRAVDFGVDREPWHHPMRGQQTTEILIDEGDR